MDLALNNLQRLICHKTPKKQTVDTIVDEGVMATKSGLVDFGFLAYQPLWVI